jgi:hypothetical protein
MTGWIVRCPAGLTVVSSIKKDGGVVKDKHEIF